jgi:cytochrome c oxidase subunit 1
MQVALVSGWQRAASRHKPGFLRRGFFSTNHKDIGTLYLIFAVCAGLIGAIYAQITRMELQAGAADLSRRWTAF